MQEECYVVQWQSNLESKVIKIAVLDLREESANKIAKEIKDAGGEAIGVAANVLEKDSLEKAKEIVNDAFGNVDILVNGAGGNHPLGTTSNPFFAIEDLKNTAEGFKTFFDFRSKRN